MEEVVGEEGAGEGVGFGVEGGGKEEEGVPEALGEGGGSIRGGGRVRRKEGAEGGQCGGEGGVGEGAFDEAGAGAAEGGVFAFEEGSEGLPGVFGGESGEVAKKGEGLFLPKEESVGLGEGVEPGEG